MKILVVYYSRGGSTKTIAEGISSILGSDIEEIEDTKSRKGILGFLLTIPESLLKKTTILKKSKKDPSDYDVVVMGTPVWTSNVSVPIRTYLQQQKDRIGALCFFCTECGSGHEKVFREMEQLAGKKPKALLAISRIQVLGKLDKYDSKIKIFCRDTTMRELSY